MTAEPAAPNRRAKAPSSIRWGLVIVVIGMLLALADVAVDTMIAKRFTTGPSTAAETVMPVEFAWTRLIAYGVAAFVTVLLCLLIGRRANYARVIMASLLGLFAVWNAVNLAIMVIEYLAAGIIESMGSGVEDMVANLMLASMAADAVLIAMATVSMVLLLVGRDWTQDLDDTG